MTPCRRVLPLLEAYGDGELGADRALEVEQHLAECTPCAERSRLDHAIKLSTRKACGSPCISADFQARVAAALAAERAHEATGDTASVPPPRPMSWRAIAPLAAAAGFALMFAASKSKSPDASTARAAGSTANASLAGNGGNVTATVDQLIDELVTHHVSPQKPEVTEPGLVQRLEPEVGVPVQLPPSLSQYGARWEGASVVPVAQTRAQRAASLRYDLGGHRVTLYVYNSQRFPLRATLEPRVIRNLPVYVGSRRGYSIAAVEKRGVGYAVATDLNDRESAELVATLY